MKVLVTSVQVLPMAAQERGRTQQQQQQRQPGHVRSVVMMMMMAEGVQQQM